MNFAEFSAVRKRKQAEQGAREGTDADAATPTPAADTRDAPGMSVNRFLGSRGFQIVVICGVLVECALMPLSLARLDVWVRLAAECGVYAVVLVTLVELILAAISVEQLRALLFADAVLQLALALALAMQFGLEHPVIAWVPFLRGIRIFECISYIDESWQRLLQAAESESRSAHQQARDLSRQLEEAAAAARREDETNLRLKEALDIKAAEVQMLHEALTIAAEQQQALRESLGVSAADDDAAEGASSSTRPRKGAGRRAGGESKTTSTGNGKAARQSSKAKGRAEMHPAAPSDGAAATKGGVDGGESTDDDDEAGDGGSVSTASKRKTFVVAGDF